MSPPFSSEAAPDSLPDPNSLRGPRPPSAIDNVLQFKRESEQHSSPIIYGELADHQRIEPWQRKDLFIELHRWANLFNEEFSLQVPEVALGIDHLRITRRAHFRYGHNAFGLKGEIVISTRALTDPFWRVLGTLLHELLHGWQQAHGSPGRGNYHNRQFREKAKAFGLLIDERGLTRYEPGSRFFALLEREGIAEPQILDEPTFARAAGNSKLRKWSCGCTNVRVGTSRFWAQCMLCGQEFLPAE